MFTLKDKNDFKLSEFEKDALREVGSIGAGHAATALSQLIDQKVLIKVPHLEIISLLKLPRKIVRTPESLIAAVYVRVLGDISGTALFVTSRQNALRIVALLKGHKKTTQLTLSDPERELLKQAGGIMIASYLNALARFTDLLVLPSQPSFAYDMAGAILEAVTLELGLEAKVAIVLDTDFKGEESKVGARLVFLPSPISLALILQKIGVS
jgi:chemotaxis protein CheC